MNILELHFIKDTNFHIRIKVLNLFSSVIWPWLDSSIVFHAF